MAKVMLVEDDNNLREIYSARLQAEGYDIVTAKDGEEALVVAKAERPELVISDVMMPKISGFEMLDILRNTDGMQDVKVIMLTALGQSDDQQRADKLGANRYLVKSQVTLEDIIKAAHDLLEGEDEAAMPDGVLPADANPTPDPAVAATPATPVESTPLAVEPASVAPAPVTEPVTVAPEPLATPPADPVVPAEPIAATPPVVPEPAAAPVVEAAPVSPAPALASPLDATMAEATTQEQAEVDAKIEDFIAGASSDPLNATAPVAMVAPAADTAAATPGLTVEGATGVSTDATPPAAVAAPVTTDAPAATDAAAADDQLMQNAVNQLMASTPAGQAAAAPATAPIIQPTETPAPASQPAPAAEPAAAQPAPVAPAPAVSSPAPVTPTAGGNPFAPQEVPSNFATPAPAAQAPVAVIPAPTPAAPTVQAASTPATPQPAPATAPGAAPAAEQTTGGSVPVAHKKVIQPLDTEPKPDIASLVALEEAKEAAAAPPPGPVATIASATHEPLQAPLGQPTAPVAGQSPAIGPIQGGAAQQPFGTPGSPDQPLDPNSIAL